MPLGGQGEPAAFGVGVHGFAGFSPVGRYWLSRCAGFEVRAAGRRVGRVEAVGFDLDGACQTLLVRMTRRRKPVRLTTASVDRVEPWERVLVLTARREERPTPRLARLVSDIGRLGPPARNASLAALGALRELRRVAPRVRTSAVRAGKRGALVCALAIWVYAFSVFHLARFSLWFALRGAGALRPLSGFRRHRVAQDLLVRSDLDGHAQR